MSILLKVNQLRNQLVNLISVAKQERQDATDFVLALRDRIVVLEAKADAGQVKLQDHETRITALEP